MKHTSFRLITRTLFLAVALIPLVARAQTSWKGTTSADWSDSANWTAGTPGSTVDAIIGDASFTGANQPTLTSVKSTCKSLTIGAGAKASILTVNHGLTVLGDILIGVNGTIDQSSSKAISLTGNWINLGAYILDHPKATVTFSGTSQTLSGATTFNLLKINTGSRTVLNANISVGSQLIVSGTLDPGVSPTFTVSGHAKLSLKSGGTLLVRASTFDSNYALTGAIAVRADSTVDYAAATLNQTVANGLTYATLRISGGLTKTLAGNLTALNGTTVSSGNILVVAGTLDLSSFSADRQIGAGATVGGTVSVANGATLKIGGTHTFPANYRTHSLGASSTVEYSGANQVVAAESYGNLTLSSSGGAVVKTMPASALIIAGNLTSSVGTGTSVSFTAAAAITVRGNVVLGSSTTFNGGSFAHSFGGNWTNNGTFTGSTGSVTFSGAGAVMSGTGANNFNNLTITGAGVAASTSTSFAVAGNFAATGAGTFTHLSGGSGSLTLSGAAKTISGTGITFNHLVMSGTITTTSSFTIGGDLSVSGSLTASAGTITMTGPANTMSGVGAITFNGLDIRGGISTARNFSIESNLSVSGTLNATAGTASFVGTSTVSGSPSLFNVTLNGTRLQLGASVVLGIAGSLAVTAGTFDASTTTPNTVNYNASGAQTLLAITYDNLSCSGSGTKTAGGALTVLGNLAIGSGTSFSAGSFTHSLSGNWINNGSFVPGSSVVQLVGGSGSSISGVTTFNTLTINKSSATTVVSLNNNISVSLLNMTSGPLLTGASTVTITSNRTGNGIILGTITRTHAFIVGTSYAFESPNNSINFSAATSVSSVTVRVVKGRVNDFPFGTAANRQYNISLAAAGSYTATLRLHYEDSELNGNAEAGLRLLRFEPPWTVSGATARDTVSNWVEQNSLADITGRWTVSDNPKIVAWNGSVSTAWETAANWDAVSGIPAIPPGSNEVVSLGTMNFVHPPTISSAVTVRSLFFDSAKPTVLTLGAGGSLTTLGNIAGDWRSNAVHTIQVGSQALTVTGDLQMSDGTNGHAINLNVDSGTVAVSADLIQTGGASFTMTGSGALEIGRDFAYESGAFDAGSGTVIYNGAAAQLVAGTVPYNNLSFAKSAGTATLTNSATISGSLVLTNGGTFLVSGALVVSNNVTLYTNATLDGGSSTISVGGNWTNQGTFTPGDGTVAFNGINLQTIATSTFNHFKIDKSANLAALAGNLVINGDLTVASGTLDLSNFSAVRSVFGGTLALAANTTLRVGGGFPPNFEATLLDTASTVEYYGSGAQVVSADDYGHLYLSNGGALAKTLAGDSSIAGDLVINSGAALDGGAFSLSLLGNWTNNGAFTPASSSVTLGGSSKNLSGATTFNNLSVPGSYTAVNAIVVQGTMNLNGTYHAGGNSCTFGGDFLNAGALTSSGTITFAGTSPQTLALNAGFNSTGTVNFNGSVAPAFNSLAAPNFQDVNINNSGGIVPDIGWTIQGNFAVSGGAVFTGGSASHTFNRNFINSGTVTSAGTLVFNPSSAATLALGGASFSSVAVVFGGTGPMTFSAGGQQFAFVTVANTHPAGVTPAGNWTLSGSLFIGPTAILNGGAGLTHTISGDFSDNGSFSGGTSLVIMTGAADPLNGASIAGDGSGSTTFNHLTIAGLVGGGANFNVSGNFTNNGTFDGTGSVVTFAGSTPSILGGSTTPTPFETLVIAKSTATAILAVNLSELTTLTVASGTLDSSTFAITQNALGGVLAVNGGAILRIGGANTLPVFGTYVFDPAGTVEYYGAAPQTIAAVNYGNLVSSSTGARTLPSSSTIGIAGTFVPGSNAYTTTDSTINYNGAGLQTIARFNYDHLTSSSSGARVLSSSGTIGVAGTFTPGGNSYTVTGSTINFNGGDQDIPPFTYHNLTITGSGIKSLTGDIAVNRTLDLEAGTLADGGFTLMAQGDVINETAHTGSGRILLTGGAAPHSLTGTGSYADLELNDSQGAALSLTDLSINSRLTFTAGLLNTDTNIVIIGSAGKVARVSGHVVGNLRKFLATGSSATNTFEVGDPANYSPATVLLSNITTGGNLTARVTLGDHPDIIHSGLSPTRSVNRYWTITNSATAFGSYRATFNFAPGDIDVPASPTNFILAKLDGTKWTLPAIISRTDTSIQADGMTNFSAFAVAEPFPTNAPAITSQPQGQRVNLDANAGFAVIATGPGSLSYQWRWNGGDLAGATSSMLTITNAQDANAGNYSVVIDNGGLSATSSNAVLTINHAPTLLLITDQSVNELTTMTVMASASDPDGGVLTYSLLPVAPPGVSINSSGVITWMPTEAQGPGTYTISVQVDDNGTPSLSATNRFTVVVNEVNTAPVLAALSNLTNFSGVTLTVTNAATDSDFPANHLTFSLGTNAPPGAAIDSNTGVFTWTLPGPNGSVNPITVIVTDDGSPALTDSRTFTVVVVPASAPRITDIRILNNGHSHLSIAGTPGQTFWIQAAPNLESPILWTSIGTNAIASDSLSQFEDFQTANYRERFYRLAAP